MKPTETINTNKQPPMRHSVRNLLFGLGLLSALNLQPSICRAQGTAFTYQGRLDSGGSPANGLYDFSFALYDAPNLGGYWGGLTNSAVPVSNGLFTVTLDFGAPPFVGGDLWLRVGVRTNGGGAFTLLLPRQRLTPTPYAIHAGRAQSAESVAFAGVTSTAILNGTITADDLSSTLWDNSFWKLQGNTGAGNFLGSTDNQPLEVRVNNTTAWRARPNGTSTPSLIGGHADNYIDPAAVGAVIGGGGNSGGFENVINSNGYYGTIGGGIANAVDGPAATVAGGNQNFATGVRSFVGGGTANWASADGATVGGGNVNLASGEYGFVGSGQSNLAQGAYSVVGGGTTNSALGEWATVGGGDHNRSELLLATVGGGGRNVASGAVATVAGGWNNQASASFSTIGGGQLNVATAENAVIAGGAVNVASAHHATVAGGSGNVASAPGATIPGGIYNRAIADCSFAAGRRAKADHAGSFVWADDTDADFQSTTNKQFAVRANNGVLIQATNTALDLRGGGAIRVAGAGVGTGTPAFIHRANSTNTSAHITTMDHPHCNGDPEAILLVTHNWSADTAANRYETEPVGVYYNGSRWAIYHENPAVAIPIGRAFNVLVIKP